MARKTAAEAALTRQAIVDEARKAFAANGYAASSTTEIAQGASVSRGALYHHFIDKAALFEAVFTDLCAECDATVMQAAGGAGDARTAVDRGARAALEFACRADYRQIALTDAIAVLGLERWHELDAAHGLSSMQLGLELLAGAGQLAAPPTLATTHALFGALTQLSMSCGRGELTVDDAAAAFAVLLDALRPAHVLG
ncbi:MAG: TetR family transcriptional regulator [Actinomycetes bacterium]